MKINFKKIFCFILAVVMCMGIAGVADTENYVVYAEDSYTETADGFITGIDEYGMKYVIGYKGKGGDIVIPDDVVYIKKNAFKDNYDITGVTISEGCLIVGAAAFQYCANLKKVTVKQALTIGEYAFEGCVNLKNVTIDSEYTTVYPYAFDACKNLKKVAFTNKSGEIYIDKFAFVNCASLKNVSFSSSLKIDSSSFLNCSKLTRIELPEKAEIVDTVSENLRFNNYSGWDSPKKFLEDYYNGLEDSEYEYSNLKNYTADGSKKLYIPVESYKTVKSKYAVNNYEDWYVDFEKVTANPITFVVSKGSKAQTYAENNEINFVYNDADDLNTPKNFNAKALSYGNCISMTWDTVKGADGYIVYIYNSSTKKYEKFKTIYGGSSDYYTQSGFTSGKTYKIKIAAYIIKNGKAVHGKFSEAKSVKVK